MGKITKKTAIRSITAEAADAPVSAAEAKALTGEEKRAAISRLSEGKPSEHAAFVQKLRDADRKTLGFTQIPVPIVDMFDEMAKAAGLDKKEYFYQLMRMGGANIPASSEFKRYKTG